MRLLQLPVFLCVMFAALNGLSQNTVQYRFNQLGYRTTDQKTALIFGEAGVNAEKAVLRDKLTGETVLEIPLVPLDKGYYELSSVYELNFSSLTHPGTYFLEIGGESSADIFIGDDVYLGAADYLLNYLRSRRCGYNPYYEEKCHEHDGVIVYHPEREGEKIDVSGGWHDASDYLQYVTTSANATFQLLFAYEQNPHAFADHYDARGHRNANGIPDILDEAKWGLDWLVKMNPEPGLMFHQIADDRDHLTFGFPHEDTVDYGYGEGMERPVYYVTGKPQGLMNYKNRSDGKANIAGKFASCFALGAELLKPFYPEFAASLLPKARAAYLEGKAYPGVCQTAPCRAPYFYEEENWTDDMELAAAQLYLRTGEVGYLNDALEYADKEPVTPWMTRDSVRHYQYYPFVNLGHYYLSGEEEGSRVRGYFNKGIQENIKRGEGNIFRNGIPFVWCSNNLTAGMLTQMGLQNNKSKKLAGSAKTEAALRDWLFGKNPWGTSMIVGLPMHGDYPADTHSAISHFTEDEPWGGLVDGPVYGSIFNSLKGVKLSEADEYEPYQTSRVVYHDDWADYSTNEPTMDGTASLAYYLASMVPEHRGEHRKTHFRGATISGDTTQRKIALLFTGHDRAEGFEVVQEALRNHKVKASFFLTGDFYRNPEFNSLVDTLMANGHYLGAHSDKHLLYCSWEDRDSLLVTEKEFSSDLRNNYRAMAKHGIKREAAYYYLPSYEWYNESIAAWTRSLGLKLINHTPGTNSNQDWTLPEMGDRYFSNEKLWNDLLSFEEEKGLNGFHLLLHFGTDPARKEKFYNRLDELIGILKERGYEFVRIDEMHGVQP